MHRSLAACEILEYQPAGCRSTVAGDQVGVGADCPVRTPGTPL